MTNHYAGWHIMLTSGQVWGFASFMFCVSNVIVLCERMQSRMRMYCWFSVVNIFSSIIAAPRKGFHLLFIVLFPKKIVQLIHIVTYVSVDIGMLSFTFLFRKDYGCQQGCNIIHGVNIVYENYLKRLFEKILLQIL